MLLSDFVLLVLSVNPLFAPSSFFLPYWWSCRLLVQNCNLLLEEVQLNAGFSTFKSSNGEPHEDASLSIEVYSRKFGNSIDTCVVLFAEEEGRHYYRDLLLHAGIKH
jgi:hypothetical protein